jgi:hypothetical protein
MKKNRKFFSLCYLLLFGPLNVNAEILGPVPLGDFKSISAEIYPFCFWRMEYRGKSEGKYEPLIIDEKGSIKHPSHFSGKANVDLKMGKLDVFPPSDLLRGGDLNQSKEVISPDGKWSVKFHWDMTFADDEKNIQIIVKDIETGREEKEIVPTSSMGVVYPSCWNFPKDIFYFLVEMGGANDKSFNLWQYDLKNKSFCCIGITDGRFFLSPDGKWIVWETGRLAQQGRKDNEIFYAQLVLFNVQNGKNYRLTEGKSVNLFDHWEK